MSISFSSRKIVTMVKKYALPAVLAALVLFLAWFIFWGFNNGLFVKIYDRVIYPNTVKEDIILFTGKGCAHCQKVDDYVQAHNVKDTVVFAELEVFNSSANQNLLEDKAQTCGLPVAQIGVPFLWDGTAQKCVIGDYEIIKFFQAKLAKKP